MQESGEERLFIEGSRAVGGAIEAGVRRIDRILLDRRSSSRGATRLALEAERRAIPVERIDREQIDRLVGSEGHGGIAAEVSPRRYRPIADIAEELRGQRSPLVVMLDGIEDPYNLGFAIRSLWASGVDAIVLRDRQWGRAEGTILRSSAGAFDVGTIGLVERAEDGAEIFARSGFRVAATDRSRGSRSIFEIDLAAAPTFLLVGGERRGVTRSFIERCDLVLEVPYGRPFDGSLPAASAATVIGFEAMRQRGHPDRE